MKKSIYILFLILPFLCHSQIQISGTVKDTSGPIEFANIILKDANGEIANGAISDTDGKFILNTSTGNYKIVISFMGYDDWGKEIFLTETIDLGVIVLDPSKSELDEIVINSEKPLIERKTDRFVVNIENIGLSSTRKAMELLSLAPGVFVTNQGSISINGSSGTGVMINGRLLELSGQDLTNYINTIDSDTIKAIEVITNPSAKYDASGTGGLLNIVLKKNSRNGWKGSIKAGFRQGDFSKVNSGLNLSYGTNAIVIYGGLSYDNGKSTREIIQKRFFENETVLFNQESNETFNFNNLNGKIGVDYNISKNHFIALETAIARNGEETPQKNLLQILNSNNLDSLIRGDFFQKKTFKSHSSSLYYKWEIDTIGTNLKVIGTHLIVKTKVKDDYDSNYFDSNKEFIRNQKFRSDVPIDVDISTLQLDFEYPFLEKQNIYAGSKLSSINTNNDNRFEIFQESNFVNDQNRTNTFKYDETIFAGYLDYSTSFGKTDFEIGVRGEYSETIGVSKTTNQSFSNKYLDWFPSLFIMRPYGKSENHSLSFSYSRRIERPYYNDLNPFQYFIDNFSSTVGNPELQPQYTNGFELSTNLYNKYSLSFFYRITDDIFAQITRQDDTTNQTVFIRENYDQLDNYGLALNIPIKVTKWWKIYNNLVYAEKKYKIDNYQNNKGFWMCSLYTAVTLTENLSFDLQSYYQTASVQGIFNIDPIFNTDFSISTSLFKNKIDCSLSITDIFKTYKEVSEINFENQNSFVSQSFDTQRIALSLQYDFSSGKEHSERKKQTTDKAEKQRINSN